MINNIIRVMMVVGIMQFVFADVLITELADPQNSSDAGRFVELYNNGDADVDFSTGWVIQRWTNGNADPSTPKDLTGVIPAGGFYIVCNDADKFSATYGLTCDQDIGTGGPADSNGDDNVAILDETGTLTDIFGVPGEDGTGTGHEFEDGRAERVETVSAANPIWDVAEWYVDNGSGGGDGNQYAPEGFDPASWIGAGEIPTCDDIEACNFGEEGACEYVVDCAGVCGGDAVVDCAGVCEGTAVEDECGVCEGDGSTCTVSVTFSVDMNVQGITGDIKVRTSTINGDYNPSDWFVMNDEDLDLVYTYTMTLVTGNEYGYNFNNSDGSGYESGDGLVDCAGGNYGNDRYVTPGDVDLVLDAVCWESCEACPEVILGCTDPLALNYDPAATEDDGSCFYEWPEVDNLFFSEYAEGTSNNKYLEIYNATEGDVDLSGYSLSSCSNGCDSTDVWDYPDNVTFDVGTIITAGDVFVVCHGSADSLITIECDQTFTYLSNGDDVMALTQVGSGTVLDVIGTTGDDPGNGWDVAGVTDATKDHTLVRKAEVLTGNTDWAMSAGTNEDDSEWLVFSQNTWDYLGSHPHDFASICDDETACNFGEEGDCVYPEPGYDCDGNMLFNVTFNLDMGVEGVGADDIEVRLGYGNPWFVMTDDDADLIYSYTMELAAGDYSYNFYNGGYESGDGLVDCAGGNYGNDRYITVSDADIVLAPVCWESCDVCLEDIPGCMDELALNYDPAATYNDDSCIYIEDAGNLFFSEYAEGSSNNKYLEIYNASDVTVDLTNYAFPSVSNAPDVPGEYEYWNAFSEGAVIEAGGVYIIAHGSADSSIVALANQTHTYLSNGDDGYALVFGVETGYVVLDWLGNFDGDPGSGWDVAGVANATKDHTLVRKAEVLTGSTDWALSAGTNEEDSDWIVFDIDTWDYLGSHPHEFEVVSTCDDPFEAVLGENSASGADEWYEYTVTTDSWLTITSQNETGDAQWDTYLMLLNSCEVDEEGNFIDVFVENDDCCDYWGPSTVEFLATAGSVYTIFWDDRWSSEPFTWFITEGTPPEQPPAPFNLVATTEEDDYDGDGVLDNAISWTWDHADYSEVLDCDGEEIPAWWVDQFVGDGECDPLFNCEEYAL
ncbi:MAG: lamin tail domain-containing protein, partial [Candidatus Marinimicrobia bacterium]|nr:lamin tail domain-containing protein [Candidatus Neomarinimicrobiota bacterium]